MFKFKCECEFCGHEELLNLDESSKVCEACNDTGDTRSNIEKYGCINCEYYEGIGSCELEPVWLIEDINCPKVKT